MRTEQKQWMAATGWTVGSSPALGDRAQLAIVFGAGPVLRRREVIEAIKNFYPAAHILGCSTAGEICGTQVADDSVCVTAVAFDRAQIRGARVSLEDVTDSFAAGEKLALALPAALPGANGDGEQKLAHVFVLSDGLKVNGSQLVRGLMKHLPGGITVTGGLAADGERFGETLVFWDRVPETATVAVLGLYGSRLKVGFGSLGGWDPFGPERLITRSKGNVLHQLDGQSALDLYKKYLGDHAKGLPATGLLFPLSLRTKTGETAVVRTILSVDESDRSMTFAGDVPEGAYARLMKANFDRLIDGAVGAAKTSYQAIGSSAPDLAILISCVGRKLLLKQRVEEEVEGVRDIFGSGTRLTGFYSYGEISPFTPGAKCELHNQTMTITTLSES
jgi:hypothetical protein